MVKSSGQEKSKPEGEGRRPGRRRRNDAGDRARAQIVDAALRTLLAEGYAGASTRAIATTGGFSAASIFYHFGSVDALLLAVMDQVSGERIKSLLVNWADESAYDTYLGKDCPDEVVKARLVSLNGAGSN